MALLIMWRRTTFDYPTGIYLACSFVSEFMYTSFYSAQYIKYNVVTSWLMGFTALATLRFSNTFTNWLHRENNNQEFETPQSWLKKGVLYLNALQVPLINIFTWSIALKGCDAMGCNSIQSSIFYVGRFQASFELYHCFCYAMQALIGSAAFSISEVVLKSVLSKRDIPENVNLPIVDR